MRGAYGGFAWEKIRHLRLRPVSERISRRTGLPDGHPMLLRPIQIAPAVIPLDFQANVLGIAAAALRAFPATVRVEGRIASEVTAAAAAV